MWRWNNAVGKGIFENCIQRIHNSYAINLLNVVSIGKEVEMKGYKRKITVTEKFCPNIMDYFVVFNTTKKDDDTEEEAT